MKILTQNYSNGNLEMLEVPMITSTSGLLVEKRAKAGAGLIIDIYISLNHWNTSNLFF